jgi:hypothetical protein
MREIRIIMVVALSASAVLLGSVQASRADVQPGEVINKTNASKATDLISPGVMWILQRGMEMQIVPYKRIELPPEYKEATEKYSGQVKLTADGRDIEGWVAGLPFPNIDTNDPQVANKIMQNYDHRPYHATDDVDLRNFDADTGTLTETGLQVERHFLLDHLRALNYVGRLYVDPKPEILPNSDGVRGKSSLHPIIEPYDLKGVGSTSIRYLSPDRQDDTWLYIPTLRRVRRLSSAQRSDALWGQDTDVDSYAGYAGQVSWFEWKFIGEKEMLGTFHNTHFPVKWCPGEGDYVHCGEWEKRPTWIVEGVPKMPQYAYGKRILFIDKESYLVSYSDIFDRSMQLWKVWINNFSFAKQAAPGLGTPYPFEQSWNASITCVDVQLNHATKAALPSAKYAGEVGFYYNMGEKAGLTEDFFTVAHLIASGN